MKEIILISFYYSQFVVIFLKTNHLFRRSNNRQYTEKYKRQVLTKNKNQIKDLMILSNQKYCKFE